MENNFTIYKFTFSDGKTYIGQTNTNNFISFSPKNISLVMGVSEKTCRNSIKSLIENQIIKSTEEKNYYTLII